MRIFVTGATGFVGRRVVAALLEAGHRAVATSRSLERARDLLGPDVDLLPSTAGLERISAALSGCDAVINLAGEPVVGGRWTAGRVAAIRTSRVDATRRLVSAVQRAEPRPSVLVSASAVGIYGDRGEEILDSDSVPGEGTLAEITQAWEAEALAARSLGLRVALPRLGVVLGRGGGFLGRVAPLHERGLGGALGSGRQWLPWVHIDDVVAVLLRSLVDPRLEGPFDLVAPTPVRQRQLSEALASVYGRSARLPAPAVALRLALGEGASVLLDSARVRPSTLEALGYPFRYPEPSSALRAALGAP
jgi:uncharacterized protein (TIGR01777 family)